MEIENKALACARPLIDALGFELVDVEYAKEDGLMCLTFFIWSRDGVSLDSCQLVSSTIDEPVEKADVTGGRPYCLCVSSPGERVLKTPRDFERNVGSPVMVELAAPIKGKKKKFLGTLLSYDADEIVLVDKNQEQQRFALTDIKSVKPYIGF